MSKVANLLYFKIFIPFILIGLFFSNSNIAYSKAKKNTITSGKVSKTSNKAYIIKNNEKISSKSGLIKKIEKNAAKELVSIKGKKSKNLLIIDKQIKPKKYKKSKTAYIVPTETHLVVDANTGKILQANNAHIQIYPASLTKLATLAVAFDAIKSGKFTMDSKLYVSKKAESMPPCKLGLKAGEYITMRDAINALIVKSSNDIAVALAENIAGSEEDFAKLMNAKAKQLGMHNTNFTNASGWHHPDQKTTAMDLAKLAISHKRHHSAFYKNFAKTSFTFKNREIRGHNRVTANYHGAEGLKTGYTSHAGFNLITTATRNGKSLVGVVTGGRTAALRDSKMVYLLDSHFKPGETDVVKGYTSAKKRVKIRKA